MACKGLRRARAFLFVVGLCWAGHVAYADSQEYRDYTIAVDGKESGHSQVTITTKDDGTQIMSGKASVRISKVVFSYAYEVQATEWWKDGRLVGLKINANDNGKRSEVSGSADGNNLRLRVNATERMSRPDVWVNSYWRLADARFINNKVPVLDGDSGKEFVAQLQYLGVEQTQVGNQPIKCNHYRVTGGPTSPVDLWFDEGQRLVRQEFVEQGHKTVIHLTGVRR
jgi:hypothetical protein